MTRTILRGQSRADLIAIAPIMLGFHPEESVVVVAVRGDLVKFCARLDPDGRLRGVEEIRRAQRRVGGCRFILLGYGRDPHQMRDAVVAVWDELFRDVVDALVTDGQRYWEINPDEPLEGDGEEFDYRESAIAVQAVYNGVHVAASRAEVVLEVQPPPAHEHPLILERLDDADSQLSRLTEDERTSLLRAFMESEDPLDEEQASQLVCLLQEMDLVGEVMTRLERRNAERFRRRLVEARRAAVGEASTNVLGLLGLSCWLAGEGAQQTDCMEQLDDLAPRHLLGGVLEALHAGGVPPSDWDRWLRGTGEDVALR